MRSVIVRRGVTLLLVCVLSGVIACSPKPTSESEAIAAVAPAVVPETLPQALGDIRLALTDRDYGRAAARAKAAQISFPAEPQIHLAAAEAEAYLGNAGNAAVALQQAIDTGLTYPADALASVAFDGVRSSQPFARLRSDFAAEPVSSVTQHSLRSSADRIRAGDVEVITDGSSDYIRAGDVVLDTRP